MYDEQSLRDGFDLSQISRLGENPRDEYAMQHILGDLVSEIITDPGRYTHTIAVITQSYSEWVVQGIEAAAEVEQ